MSMVITLKLSSEELGNEDVQKLATDLCQTIVKEADINALIPEDTNQEGTKGEPITLGLLALTFVGSKAAVALFNLIKSYFDRESSLIIDIQLEDGAKLTIIGQNMKPEQIETTLNRFERFFGKNI